MHTVDAAGSQWFLKALQAAVTLNAKPNVTKQLADAYIFPRGCLGKYYADKAELHEGYSLDFSVSILTSNPTST